VPALGEHILIPVSPGELLDKKTILQIKRQRIKDAVQIENIERELALLEATGALAPGLASPGVQQLELELLEVNSLLWDLENKVRACERAGHWDEEFVQAARKIYAGNDRRAAVKRRINLLLNSSIVEEKSHT
jgi:hypothetical protein